LLRAGLDQVANGDEVFGDFEIERHEDGSLWELGRGATGVTYRALDNVLHRSVALKVIEPAAVSSDSLAMRERFLREARAAAALRHPNVAGVFHISASPELDRCYCAMELVEGETLEARVRREGPLGPTLVFEIAIQVTRALLAAAERGLVHRDLKPGNIMLARGEGAELQVKVIDFGLAKAASAAGEMELTQGGFVGTPAFASPEQFARGEIDARTDIYALGVTMWFALTGRLPFAGTTIDEIRERQAQHALPVEQLKSRAVPQPLVDLLLACLAFDPAKRPASARELLAELEARRASSARRPGSRKLALAVFSCAILAALASLFFLSRTKPTEKDVAVPKLAVLPFQSLVPAQRDEVLEMGMADALITKLSNSGKMIVPSLTSVRPYAGVDQDPLAAGRKLGVDSVLAGNVQKSGDRLRVTVRLIRIADGSSRWDATFDEKFTDVFTVQDTISQKLAEALALRLTADNRKRLTKRYTENVAAYQLYLTGRYHWSKITPPDMAKSIPFFQQAIALDPTYALAYAGLSDVYARRAITGDVPSRDAFPQAKAAATKALEIDESLAEPHATLAMIHMWFDWDWKAAESEGKRGVELNPNSGIARMAYATVLSTLERHDEAIAQAARGRELDPVSLIINAREGGVLFSARRYPEARESLQKTLELDPNFWIAHLYLGHVLVQEGKYLEAVAEFEKAKKFSGGNSEAISMMGCALARAGDAVAARAVLQELNSAQRYIPSSNIAALYLALGEPEEAIAHLEKAYEERDVRLGFLKIDPKWDALRGDPRFVSILERVGLR